MAASGRTHRSRVGTKPIPLTERSHPASMKQTHCKIMAIRGGERDPSAESLQPTKHATSQGLVHDCSTISQFSRGGLLRWLWRVRPDDLGLISLGRYRTVWSDRVAKLFSFSVWRKSLFGFCTRSEFAKLFYGRSFLLLSAKSSRSTPTLHRAWGRMCGCTDFHLFHPQPQSTVKRTAH